jgi:L-histidine N-alpha-methyltransferase
MTVSLEVRRTEEDFRAALVADVRRGLTSEPRSLPSKYFYDARGSELFEEITRLPEYYPTRAERSILRAAAGQMAAVSGADTLVELGSGSSEKTRLLLDGLASAGSLRRYVGLDVSTSALEGAMGALGRDYPGLELHGVVADFEDDPAWLHHGRRRLVVFLGSTIGNLTPSQRHRFLLSLRSALQPGDALLLGTDLVKDPARLVAAYDDAAGVTAAFNRNILDVVNDELGGDLDATAFDHVALWDPDREWVEMRLRARSATRAHLRDLGLDVALAAGEEIRTEISAKFRREGVEAELASAGLALAGWWTDAAGDFAVSLSVPVQPGPAATSCCHP